MYVEVEVTSKQYDWCFSEADVVDMAQLRGKTDTELREMGRIPYPFVYKTGIEGLRECHGTVPLNSSVNLSKIEPDRQGYFATSKGITNETYYMFTKMGRLMGTNNVDFCARLCHAATVSGLSTSIGVGAPTISLSDLIGTDLVLLWGATLPTINGFSEVPHMPRRLAHGLSPSIPSVKRVGRMLDSIHSRICSLWI